MATVLHILGGNGLDGPYQKVFTDPAFYTKKMDNLSSGQPLYIGEAEPGTSVSASVWRVRKMEYDDGNNYPPTGETWALKNAKFNKSWNNRTTFNFG